MELSYSLPTLDIEDLKPQCFSDTGLKLPSDFVENITKVSKESEWTLSKFAWREWGEDRGWGVNPAIDAKTIDKRVIVRQLQSAIKQEMWMADLCGINDNHYAANTLRDLLGDNAKYFTKVFLIKFDSDQGFIPHKDGGGYSRLYIPIYPFAEDYSRLEFYYNNQIYYIYNYVSPPPVYLFNSRAIHAVFNQGYPERVNLQVNCKLSYQEALALFNESTSK